MIAATWGPDAAHQRLRRWQVRVLERWAREDAETERNNEAQAEPRA